MRSNHVAFDERDPVNALQSYQPSTTYCEMRGGLIDSTMHEIESVLRRALVKSVGMIEHDIADFIGGEVAALRAERDDLLHDLQEAHRQGAWMKRMLHDLSAELDVLKGTSSRPRQPMPDARSSGRQNA